MWVATVDFQKVFDSIQHDSKCRCLRKQSFSEQYISLLKELDDGQSATVLTDVEGENSR